MNKIGKATMLVYKTKVIDPQNRGRRTGKRSGVYT